MVLSIWSRDCCAIYREEKNLRKSYMKIKLTMSSIDITYQGVPPCANVNPIT